MSGNGSSTFGFLIQVVAAFLVGATVFSLAGRLYQSVIIDRVTNMSESDLGLTRNPEVEDMIKRLPAEIEKAKGRNAESQRRFEEIGKEYFR